MYIKRLANEYKKLQACCPPGLKVQPDPDNILIWHFVIQGSDDSPYKGGQYYGKLQFTEKYPMEPPTIKMVTPSGRFNPGDSICMSMTVWHKDTWNPLWGVESILVGFQSFFYSEEMGVGGIKRSDKERSALAMESESYNQKIPIYTKLFGE